MIIAENISKSFGEKVIFQNLSLQIETGKCTALMGESGIGKTTLLRVLSGLESPDSGRVTGLEGMKKSYIFQENRLIDTCSVMKNILLVTRDEKRAAYFLQECGLWADKNKKAENLSGGMKRRLAIARCLAYGGDFFYLDEPFRELDEANRRKMISLLQKEIKGKTAVFITHSREEANLIADNILYCQLSPMTIQGG